MGVSRPRLIGARRLAARPDRWLDEAGVLLRGGAIERVVVGRHAQRRAAATHDAVWHDLGDGVLAPGFVNAHAHLDLSGLAGRLEPGSALVPWIGGVLRERAARDPAQLARDAARGSRRCAATGTTLVGDIDATGAVLRAGRAVATRLVVFRELLDAGDPERTAAALAGVRRALPRRARRLEGLSPHAPHTASPALLRAAAELAAARDLPVAVHWSESAEEVEWLRTGGGALAALLSTPPSGPRRSGLDRLAGAGLLGPRTLLVHGNHPARGEPARVAGAGATLVHCPGCHAWFGRAPFPLRRYLDAGVPVALGTDSLASNADLDLRRELALLRAAHPWLAPEAAWAMATLAPARALGLAGRAGELVPGAWADLVHHLPEGETAGGAASAPLEALAAGRSAVAGVWIAGRRVGP